VGDDVGPLHGLPVAHKDLAPTRGTRTTFGSLIYEDFVPDEDALIVERLRRAGAITVGKTNTPEFGAGSQTYNEVFGETLNLYDTTKTCGGPACGMVPIADGSDMGGSLRNPASFCNVVGFRPSLGRVPSWPTRAAWSSLSTEGPMARTVRDDALLLGVISGPVEALRKPLEPPRDVAVPEGLDLSLIPADVLRVYELATEPVEFAGGQSSDANGMEGSNNWAISPVRTTTGRPILANDPHRAQSVPSLRYAIHLSAPGMDATEDPEVERILEKLKSWDCVLSAPAALFEVWYCLYLRQALLKRAMEDIVEPGRLDEAVSSVTPVEDQAGDARMVLETLEKLDKRLGHEEVDQVLSSTLKEATERLEGLLGVDRADWEWGNLHQVHMVHTLSELVDRLTRARLDVGPAPRGGSGDTVGNTAYHLENLRQTGGSSWRVVVDVGEWDDSMFINSSGQSGDPASPHYSDLFGPWATDETVPLLYSRRKVEAVAERRIVLEQTGQ